MNRFSHIFTPQKRCVLLLGHVILLGHIWYITCPSNISLPLVYLIFLSSKQLLDLRQVIARMVGLDINTLAVPDYEILSRLEKLILANQSNAATVVALDTAMEGISDGFRVGYEDATQALQMATRARSPTRRIHTRARSVSPNRKKDTRSY